MTDNIVPFPIGEDQILTFTQAASVVQSRKPSSGIIVGYDEDDKIFIYNFGIIKRRDALWIAEQIKRHSQDEPIS